MFAFLIMLNWLNTYCSDFRYESNGMFVLGVGVSGDLIHLRNRSKLVERSLFAIIDLLQGAKYILLLSIWRVGG